MAKVRAMVGVQAQAQTPGTWSHTFPSYPWFCRMCSQLATTLQSMSEIPLQILTQDWLQGIISETREIESTLAEHWALRAEAQMRKHEEKTS